MRQQAEVAMPQCSILEYLDCESGARRYYLGQMEWKVEE
jgi:hypothetical protein